MGRIRRGGYILEWWIGDHSPRHVHVYDKSGRFLGRIQVPSGQPLEAWTPPAKVLTIINELIREGRL